MSNEENIIKKFLENNFYSESYFKDIEQIQARRDQTKFDYLPNYAFLVVDMMKI